MPNTPPKATSIIQDESWFVIYARGKYVGSGHSLAAAKKIARSRGVDVPDDLIPTARTRSVKVGPDRINP